MRAFDIAATVKRCKLLGLLGISFRQRRAMGPHHNMDFALGGVGKSDSGTRKPGMRRVDSGNVALVQTGGKGRVAVWPNDRTVCNHDRAFDIRIAQIRAGARSFTRFRIVEHDPPGGHGIAGSQSRRMGLDGRENDATVSVLVAKTRPSWFAPRTPRCVRKDRRGSLREPHVVFAKTVVVRSANPTLCSRSEQRLPFIPTIKKLTLSQFGLLWIVGDVIA